MGMENSEFARAVRYAGMFLVCVVVSLCLVFAISRVVAWSTTASDEARERARINAILGY